MIGSAWIDSVDLQFQVAIGVLVDLIWCDHSKDLVIIIEVYQFEIDNHVIYFIFTLEKCVDISILIQHNFATPWKCHFYADFMTYFIVLSRKTPESTKRLLEMHKITLLEHSPPIFLDSIAFKRAVLVQYYHFGICPTFWSISFAICKQNASKIFQL